MRYEEGGSLASFVRRNETSSNHKSLAFPAKLGLLMELAQGLAELHLESSMGTPMYQARQCIAECGRPSKGPSGGFRAG
jgi:hypothetical protein